MFSGRLVSRSLFLATTLVLTPVTSLLPQSGAGVAGAGHIPPNTPTTTPVSLNNTNRRHPRQGTEDRISVDLRDVTLGYAIDAISKGASVDITYSRDIVPVNKRVSLTHKSITVLDALNAILAGTGIEPRVSAEKVFTLVRPFARIYSAAPVVDLAETTPFSLKGVVVTGTIAPTSQKAIPNAITVITREQLLKNNVTNISQLFRGQIASIFSPNEAPAPGFGTVQIFARGASGLAGTNTTVKTYIDGIELANPAYISQIDINSIERIEVLPGPQASTVYGSNALNGVIQIFTRKGKADKTRLRASLSLGSVHSPERETYASRHEQSAQVEGGSKGFSYNAGASHSYIGPWFPSYLSRTSSVFSSGRLQKKLVILEPTLRYTMGNFGGPEFYTDTYTFDKQASGDMRYLLRPAPGSWLRNKTKQNTGGLTISYTPKPSWNHKLVLGQDKTGTEEGVEDIAYRTPGDSIQTFSEGKTTRNSLGYNTTIDWYMSPMLHSIWTAGADGWKYYYNQYYASTINTTGTLLSVPLLQRRQESNSGYFAQGQIAVKEALFFTGGLRFEDNSNYGSLYGTSFSPRAGISYLLSRSTYTAKLRGAYGKATRPPQPNLTNAVYTSSPIFGTYQSTLAAPNLGPETQTGGEWGLELYINNQFSIHLTQYSQVVDNLILKTQPDSVQSLLPTGGIFTYALQSQYKNVGQIRNSGVEAQTSLTYGSFTSQATYTTTKSRITNLDPTTPGTLKVGDSFIGAPERAGSISTTYSRLNYSFTFSATHTGPALIDEDAIYLIRQQPRISTLLSRINSPILTSKAAAYTTLDINAARRFGKNTDLFMSFTNLTESDKANLHSSTPSPGRSVILGIRIL